MSVVCLVVWIELLFVGSIVILVGDYAVFGIVGGGLIVHLLFSLLVFYV